VICFKGVGKIKRNINSSHYTRKKVWIRLLTQSHSLSKPQISKLLCLIYNMSFIINQVTQNYFLVNHKQFIFIYAIYCVQIFMIMIPSLQFLNYHFYIQAV
jgi:hypothetical protein